jgi:hypothetical protein
LIRGQSILDELKLNHKKSTQRMIRFYYHGYFCAPIISILIYSITPSLSYSQTLLIDPNGNGGFETGITFTDNGWTSVNGTQTNKWWLGAVATPSSGARCAYVSNNGSGSTYNYATTASTTHFYRDVIIPAGQSDITLTFSWKGNGESNQDFLKVFICPTTVNVIAGTALAATYQVGGTYNLQSSWQTATINLTCTGYGGTTQRLVFSWNNNNNATTGQPPAAVDNISMTSFTAGAANDLPCNAVPLTLGVIQSGDNTCSGGSGEPTCTHLLDQWNVKHCLVFRCLSGFRSASREFSNRESLPGADRFVYRFMQCTCLCEQQLRGFYHHELSRQNLHRFN